MQLRDFARHERSWDEGELAGPMVGACLMDGSLAVMTPFGVRSLQPTDDLRTRDRMEQVLASFSPTWEYEDEWDYYSRK